MGIIGKLECDFIVRKRERYAYVQVSMSVQDPNVEEREFRPFTKLADGIRNTCLVWTRCQCSATA